MLEPLPLQSVPCACWTHIRGVGYTSGGLSTRQDKLEECWNLSRALPARVGHTCGGCGGCWTHFSIHLRCAGYTRGHTSSVLGTLEDTRVVGVGHTHFTFGPLECSKPQTPNPKLQTPNSKSQTTNSKPQTQAPNVISNEFTTRPERCRQR